MVSSDSDSDSDDWLVHKTVRTVRWSDDESSDDEPARAAAEARAGGAASRSGRDGADAPPTGSARGEGGNKRKRGVGSGGPSGATDAIEIDDDDDDDDDARGRARAASDFLAPRPTSASGARRLDDDDPAMEELRKHRAALAELRRAAAEAPSAPEEIDVANDDDDDDDAPEILDGAEDAKRRGEDGANPGAMLTIFVQLPGGKRVPCACREGAPFEKILANFLATDEGRAARESGKIGDAPRLVFDGDTVDLRTTTPRDLEMEDEDVVDVS